jgi:hypothetical protein
MAGVAAALAVLAWAPSALAAPPAVTASASVTSGFAPLRVTLTATGDAAAYRWDLGDGAAADGPVVSQTYRAGSWTAVVTATSATGETAQAAVSLRVAADGLTLRGPARADWDSGVTLRGRLASGRARIRIQVYRGRTWVAGATTRAGGAFAVPIRLRTPGRYQARHGALRSAELAIMAVPRLVLSLPETAVLGDAVRVRARAEPRWAGRVEAQVDGRRVRLSRGGGMRLGAPRVGSREVRLRLVPNPGFAAVRRSDRLLVVVPELGPGSRGPAVRELERRLREQRYVLQRVDASYDLDTVEAVYAFQSVHGLPQTGRVDAALWRLIARSTVPAARQPGTHIEVSKARQYLLDVRGGLVVRVIHVSTGATGNTPIGTWRVYRTVPGFDWVLYYPLYFLRGFAIRGYPSVPPYPASHGCVRIPMWVATSLYSDHGLGTTVVVY